MDESVLFIGFFSLFEISAIEVDVSKSHHDASNQWTDVALMCFCDLQRIQQMLFSLLPITFGLLPPLQCLHPEISAQSLEDSSFDAVVFSVFFSLLIHDLDASLEHILSLLEFLKLRLDVSGIDEHFSVLSSAGAVNPN